MVRRKYNFENRARRWRGAVQWDVEEVVRRRSEVEREAERERERSRERE